MSYALVLLCGGLSTRMGTNKAFLPFGEYTLMEYQVRRFRPYLFIRSENDRFLDASCCQTELHSHS